MTLSTATTGVSRIDQSIEKYKEYIERDPSDRNLDCDKEANLNTLRKTIHMIYWIITCIDGRLDLHQYHRK